MTKFLRVFIIFGQKSFSFKNMSTEKPFEFFPGKIKRIRTFAVFADAVNVEQKRKFPVSLKIRHGFLRDHQENLDEILRETIKKLIEPSIYEIKRTFQNSSEENCDLFVPAICLNISEIFVNTDEILSVIESEIGKFTKFRVRLDANFVASVKDAVVAVFHCIGGRKSDANFDGTVQELIEIYSKLKKKTTIFISFSDFFAFDFNVLNDILHIFASNLKNLPVFILIPVLICGPRSLNSFVSMKILQKFDVKTIDTPPVQKFLDEFFVSAFSNDEFVMHFNDKSSLMLLNSQFSNSFFSLKRFVDGLKLLLLDHFRDEIYSVFDGPSTCLDQVFDRISSEIDNFAPEFRRSPMKSPLKKLKTLFERRIIDDLRRDLLKFNDFRTNFWLVLCCFRALLSFIPVEKRKEREIFSYLLDPQFMTSDDWNQVVTHVNSFKRQEIENFLAECKRISNQIGDVGTSAGFADFIDEQTKNFENLDDFQTILDEQRAKSADNETPVNGKRYLLRDLQQDIQNQKRQKIETDAFSIRKKEFLQNLCRQILACSKHPTTESDIRRAFCLPGDVCLRRFCVPSTRNDLRQALLEPDFSFLKDKTKKIQLDCFHIFDQYDRSGASIRTKNMLKSFFDYCHSLKKSNRDVDEELLRARFYKILAEFEYLGLIKFVPRLKNKITKLIFFVPTAN